MKISIAGREIEEDDEGAEALLKTAHDQKIRPLCLCRKPHPQLQIAHIADHYFVKRLPRDAGAHALQCERFEIPLSLSGKVASAGKSIIDDQKSDGVEIKLAVALQPGKRVAPAATGAPASNTVKAAPARLSLFGLLNYLWEEAGLCEMHPHYRAAGFGASSLTASTPRSAARPRRRSATTISPISPRNSTQPIRLRTAERDSPRRIAPLAIVTG